MSGWVDSGWSEKIQSQGGLGNKAVPKVQRKIRVTAGDASNQVVLEGLDRSLSRFCSVQVGGYNLKCDSLAAHIILEAGWTFLFNNFELGAKAPIGELGMEERVGSDEFCFNLRFYRLRDDCITVMVIEDYDGLISLRSRSERSDMGPISLRSRSERSDM